MHLLKTTSFENKDLSGEIGIKEKYHEFAHLEDLINFLCTNAQFIEKYNIYYEIEEVSKHEIEEFYKKEPSSCPEDGIGLENYLTESEPIGWSRIMTQKGKTIMEKEDEKPKITFKIKSGKIITISDNGIQVHRENFPHFTPYDFASEFLKILETEFTVHFEGGAGFRLTDSLRPDEKKE